MGIKENMDGLADISNLVKLVPGVDLKKVTLSAREGFVLSRISENMTVEGVCEATGLGADATLGILRALQEKGVLTVGGAKFTENPNKPDRNGVPRSTTPEEEKYRDELKQDGEEIDLNPERRLQILSVYRKITDLSFFDLLGVSVDADVKEIRRAYFARSKEFHPDRYYMKNLGRYGDMLAEIFKQVSAAYRFLEDEHKRKDYRETVKQQHEQESFVRQMEQTAKSIPSEQKGTRATKRGPSGEYHFVRDKGLGNNKTKSHLQAINVGADSEPNMAGLSADGHFGLGKEEDADQTHGKDFADQEKEKRRAEDRRRRRQSMVHMSPVMARKKKAKGFFDQGIRHMGEGKFLAAAASLKLAVSYDPAEPNYKARYEEAVDQSREITADGFFKRAIFEESVGRHDAATKYYAKAADVLPKAAYLERAAESLLALGELMQAKEYATKAVQVAPNSVASRMVLAKAFLGASMKKNAIREIEMALKLEPGNRNAKELMRQIRRS
ncbi:MAG: DnaJ domain-containing protein [Pseudomonadota bacterium]